MPQQGCNCFCKHRGVPVWRRLGGKYHLSLPTGQDETAAADKGEISSCASNLYHWSYFCRTITLLIELFNKWTILSNSKPCCCVLLEAHRCLINVHWSRVHAAFHLVAFKGKMEKQNSLMPLQMKTFLTDRFSSEARWHCFQLCYSQLSFVKWKRGSVMRWNFMSLPAMWSLHQSTAINFFWYNCINAASNGWAYVSHWLLSVSDCVS